MVYLVVAEGLLGEDDGVVYRGAGDEGGWGPKGVVYDEAVEVEAVVGVSGWGGGRVAGWRASDHVRGHGPRG
jgi:hypothetical protein